MLRATRASNRKATFLLVLVLGLRGFSLAEARELGALAEFANEEDDHGLIGDFGLNPLGLFELETPKKFKPISLQLLMAGILIRLSVALSTPTFFHQAHGLSRMPLITLDFQTPTGATSLAPMSCTDVRIRSETLQIPTGESRATEVLDFRDFRVRMLSVS
eukprot:CAMPEP_0184289302 /NCGR_PEP_ID=MMETSP1049-20130417/1751_1 /TAXON_ID=77928 /ORGANISM="Proteomonas sulcata, Strain CCMP704" /LENGTH=160 /DNA_ID=CAMNT_0026596031 /DNA_START=111 /DNA_END=590 /DNA_ORIENTATION=+